MAEDRIVQSPAGNVKAPYLLPVARGSGLTARGAVPTTVCDREPITGRGAGPIGVDRSRMGTPQA